MKRALLCSSLALLAAGCSTTRGTSFGLPKEALRAPSWAKPSEATAGLEERFEAYADAADGALNGTQKFDVPAILAGTAGVASSAFKGVTADLGPTAGTLAAGALGFRTYYAPGSRFGAYVGGARGMSCLHSLASTLTGLGWKDESLIAWRGILGEAEHNTASPMYGDLMRIGSAVESPVVRFRTGAIRVDTEVMRKLAAPSAPDLAALYQNYDAAMRRATDEQTELVDAKTAVAGKSARAQTALDKNGQSVTMQDDFDVRAKNLIDGTSTELLKEIAGLDARVEQCVSLAV